MKEHLGPIAAAFAKALGGNAKTPFYKVVSQVLSGILPDDSEETKTH